MKTILVIDESHAVRETIAMVLGQDFVVAQRPSLEGGTPTADDAGIDLLIMGVSPAAARNSSIFSNVAAGSSCPVLFLVDSESAPAFKAARRHGDCLAKPFNPYELKEKVAGLLAETPAPARPLSLASAGSFLRYLDHPYVPAGISTLAKKFASTPLPLLIVAEAGCGQDSLARAIHALSDAAGPWLSAHALEVGASQLQARIAGTLSAESPSQALTLFVKDIDRLNLSEQSAWLDFLAQEEEKGREFWLISNSRADLLEKVYRGEFLDALYYRLGTLTLRLPPLRDRQVDIPILADRLAEELSGRLGLGKVSFSPAAVDRLRNYLWFGNLEEMEAVIARTLTMHRKDPIDAPDLILIEPWQEAQRSTAPERRNAPPEQPAQKAPSPPALREKRPELPRDSYSQEVKILISELAHELKNPMVAVKTFSQLLADRFDDPTFRVRFQQTVNSDIQRMDELLEALLDFSRFSQPAKEKCLLYEQLRRVEEELLPECIKRETALQWGKRGEAAAVFADKAQLLFAFKNILRAALGQVKPKSEIQMDVEGEGKVAISYFREAVGINPLNEYLGVAASNGEESLPLRILLANLLLERNGGGIKIDYPEQGKARIRAQLPVL
ncbi:MAG TPA: histidine kinase dimerization/phospho-acceptor domain-containing protein [Candidatus Binatia bacterium]|jgi:DNA-binding NtrC family response regulator